MDLMKFDLDLKKSIKQAILILNRILVQNECDLF